MFWTSTFVKLGFVTDQAQYARFVNALRDAQQATNLTFGNMLSSVMKFSTGFVGAFAAIGASAVGMADSVAMADQGYRLLGLHMYTNTATARELKIALDTLGVSMEDVIYDPELSRRFHQLIEDQRTLTHELGPNFEKNMVKIRDVRAEFGRLGDELTYLKMRVVSNLVEAFGPEITKLLERLRRFNDWFIQHLPQIADWITKKLKPILEDVGHVLKDAWEIGMDFVGVFQNLVGLLTGDKSLQGTTANLEDFTKAIQDCADAATHFADSLPQFFKDLAQLGTNIGLIMAALQDLSKGKFSAAWDDLGKMKPIEGMEGSNNLFIDKKSGMFDIFHGSMTKMDAQQIINQQVAALNAQGGAQIPLSLAYAIAQHESTFNQFDPSGKLLQNQDTGAMGIMQLLPETFKRYGGKNPGDATENVRIGLQLLKDNIEQYRNIRDAVAHYEGHGGADSYRNADTILKNATGMHIDKVEININGGTSLTPQQVTDATTKGIANATDQRTQRNIGQYQYGWVGN